MGNKQDDPTSVRPSSTEDSKSPIDPFYLEKIYPEPAQLFSAHKVGSASEQSVLVAFDTNALLLPYSIKAGNLSKVESVFQKLFEEKRLYVPGRVAREFVKLRDAHLRDT